MDGNRTSTFSSNSDLREEILSKADALSIELDEDKILETISTRVEDSEKWWNAKLDIERTRDDNEMRWMNKNFAVGDNALYDYQVDYKDNRIFVSIETLAANVVSRTPAPEVVEGLDSDASRELASDFQKVLEQTAKENNIKASLQMVARHLLTGYRLGVMKQSWDFNGGRLKEDNTYTGDVVSTFIRPHKIILDSEAEDPNDVPLIAEGMSKTVEELGLQFPDKKEKIIEIVGKQTGAKAGMGTRLGYKEIWFSFYDKDGNKQEGVAWKYNHLLLDHGINPYYNYDDASKSNYLQQPQKPYVLFNFLRLGKYAMDDTSLTEQSAALQDVLEKRGRQIVENADQSVSTKIFNTMQVDAGDAEKYVGDPRQNILVKGDVRTAFTRIPPEQLGRHVVEDKLDARQEIDNIFGTHAPLRGEKTASPTLGQEQMSQQSDLGRTNILIESMEMGAGKVYRQIAQLYKVFATEEHIKRYVGEEGKTTFINFSSDKIEDGIQILVQSGSMQPENKASDRMEAVELAKIGGRIDPLTFFEKWHDEKPREKAKRLFYFLFMPDKYAEEVLKVGEEGGDQDAQSAIQRIMAGENVPAPEQPSKEYVAYLNQFIKEPAFKQLDPEVQQMIIKHVKETVANAKSGLGQEQAAPEGAGLTTEPPPNQGQPQEGGDRENTITRMLGMFRQ